MTDLRLPSRHEWIQLFNIFTSALEEEYQRFYPWREEEDWVRGYRNLVESLYNRIHVIGREVAGMPPKMDYYEPYRPARFIADAYVDVYEVVQRDAATTYALAIREGADTGELGQYFSGAPREFFEIPSYLGQYVLGGLWYLVSSTRWEEQFTPQPLLMLLKAHGIYLPDLPSTAGDLVSSWLYARTEEPLLSFDDWVRRQYSETG